MRTRAPRRLGHLDEEQADSAGAGVDEDGVAGLDGVGGVGEVVGGHALEHGCGGLAQGEAVGDGDQQVRRGRRRIARRCPGQWHQATRSPGLTAVTSGADGDDGAGGFLTRDEGQLGRGSGLRGGRRR